MAERHDAGELEDLKQFARNMKISRATVFRRLQADPDFPKPLQSRPNGKLHWRTVDRLRYLELLARRARAKAARREPTSSEDRPAA